MLAESDVHLFRRSTDTDGVRDEFYTIVRAASLQKFDTPDLIGSEVVLSVECCGTCDDTDYEAHYFGYQVIEQTTVCACVFIYFS